MENQWSLAALASRWQWRRQHVFWHCLNTDRETLPSERRAQSFCFGVMKVGVKTCHVCVLIKTTVHHGELNPYFQRERITPDKQTVLLLFIRTFPPLLLRSSFLFVYYISISFIFLLFTFVSHPPCLFLLLHFFHSPSFPRPSPLFSPHFCFFISVVCFLPLVSLHLLPLVLFVFLSPSYFFFHQNQYKIGFLWSILFYFHNAYWPFVSTESGLNNFLFPFPSFWLTNMKIQWSNENILDTDTD